MTEETKPTEGNFIQINNGKNIKSWLAILIVVLGIYGSGLWGWRSLCTDVSANQQKNKEICAELNKETARIDVEIHRIDLKHTEKMTQFAFLGSEVSRRNTNSITRQEETLKWLKDNVAQINSKIDRALLRDNR